MKIAAIGLTEKNSACGGRQKNTSSISYYS